MPVERRSVDGGERKRAPRNGPPDGRGGRAQQRQGGVEAREAEQGQSRRRWDDRRRAAEVPGGELGDHPSAAARWHLPAETGTGSGDTQERGWGAKAWHPV